MIQCYAHMHRKDEVVINSECYVFRWKKKVDGRDYYACVMLNHILYEAKGCVSQSSTDNSSIRLKDGRVGVLMEIYRDVDEEWKIVVNVVVDKKVEERSETMLLSSIRNQVVMLVSERSIEFVVDLHDWHRLMLR